jgi:hypothetical protein
MKSGMCVPLLTLACFLTSITVEAQQTVGLLECDSTSISEGYTLFPPFSHTSTYLIGSDGRVVNSWASNYLPQSPAYLLENGNMIRPARIGNPSFPGGGNGGLVEEFDWDGNIVWEFYYSDENVCLHHDFKPMPNGNLIMVAWEYKSYQECIAAGRNPTKLADGYLWPEHVIEVDPDSAGGTIVWEWHSWNHMIQDYDSTKANYGVVEDHPELFDFNYGDRGRDFLHVNSIDYNAELDQIVLGPTMYGELWVIDHSTTAEEAAGHTGGNSGKGGDLLYRWGNPEAYRRGTVGNKMLFGFHDVQWIGPGLPGAGHFLLFNNGNRRVGYQSWSSIDEIVPPIDSLGNYYLSPDSAYGPEAPVWVYTAENPTDFFAAMISGCQRLPNGNTLICQGTTGRFFEVTPDTEIVWTYINPVTAQGPFIQGNTMPGGPFGQPNMVFKIHRYSTDFPGFAGHPMTTGDPVELYMVSGLTATINPANADITLTWKTHHSSFYPYNYYVYSSNEPFTGFILAHTTGDTAWTFSATSNEKFYRITIEIFP